MSEAETTTKFAAPSGASERIVFVTGKLAHDRLEKVLQTLPSGRFEWSIANAGVKVAALMTEDIIQRRVTIPEGFDRIILPGRCRANIDSLKQHFGLPVERGPDEVVDLPVHLGLKGRKVDLSKHDLRIFAELGSGFIDQSQKMTAAAMQIAEKKVLAHRS